MKKFWLIALVLVFAFSSGSCASAEKAEYVPLQNNAVSAVEASQEPVNTVVAYDASAVKSQPVETADVSVQSAPVEQTVVAEETAQEDNAPVCTVTGGGYTVDILKAEVGKDGSGNDCIVVRMKYTNDNSSPMQMFYVAMETVTQAGESLTMDGMMPNGSDPEQCNWVTPISNGESINVAFIYPYHSNEPLNFTMNIVTADNASRVLGSGSCTLEIS